MALPQVGDVLPDHGDGRGDGVDRISGLHDDVLLKVLARLGCVREAVRTGVLSRRWSGLWTSLPEFTFKDMEPEAVEAALAQVTRPALDYLDIEVELESGAAVGRASSLLRAAARLAPETFCGVLWNRVEGAAAIGLPCFDRTVSLALQIFGVPMAPPPTGEFSRLENLELVTVCNIFPALLPNCPRLRLLRIIRTTRELSEVTVHSATLEELVVEDYHDFLGGIRHIDIDAPELKEAKLDVTIGHGFHVSFSAPKVEKHVWKFIDTRCIVGVPMLGLDRLRYSLKDGVRTLRLDMNCLSGSPVPERSLAQEIARLPVADFSVLEVVVETNGHAFGPLLLHLLRIRPTIQRLKVVLGEAEEVVEGELCTQDCPCRQPVDWKSETLSLPDLEEV